MKIKRKQEENVIKNEKRKCTKTIGSVQCSSTRNVIDE